MAVVWSPVPSFLMPLAVATRKLLTELISYCGRDRTKSLPVSELMRFGALRGALTGPAWYDPTEPLYRRPIAQRSNVVLLPDVLFSLSISGSFSLFLFFLFSFFTT